MVGGVKGMCGVVSGYINGLYERGYYGLGCSLR